MTQRLVLAATLRFATVAQAKPLVIRIRPITDAQFDAGLQSGQEIEARVDGDLNGDSEPDTAYVVASPDNRIVHVALSIRNAEMAGQISADSSSSHPIRSARRG